MSTKVLDKSGLAYFWSKIKSWVTSRGYITSSGSITGNAGTATKLATARSISAGDLEFQGSANFDGSGNIALNVTNHRSIVSVGNRNNYLFHRIAYISTLAGNYADRGITFLVSKDFSGGGWGICRIILRTNNATGGQTAQCHVQWLVRSDEISADSIQVGFCKTANASYVDVFYKSAETYNSAVCRVLAHSSGRNSVGRGFTVVSTSTEANSTTATDPKTSVESYKTIADAGTALHSQAYTDIIAALDVGVVGNAATASAIAWSGVTSKPTTIAGYGITDAKIANGTITLGSNSITPLTSHQTLPTLSRTISGSGNAITDITVSGHAITATKGATFLTSHQTLPTLSLTTSGNGNAITALSVSNHAITATKGATYITSSGSITGNAATATKVVGTANNDTVAELVRGTMGSNDAFRIAIGGGNNAGWAEIATADDYNEPIYVRQYRGVFATLKRTATLLDGSGNTSFPGTVTANAFSGPLTGNVTGNCSGSSGSCTGNAATATKFASAQSVALTGDVTGSASSQAGWSIATTLANSGVTAGRYTSVNVDVKGRVTAGNVKHSYTVAANAAKNWYRIANANTSQTDTTKPIYAQFILTAYNASYDAGYYESWFVNASVFGRTAHIVILGNTSAPFSHARILYENTIADLDANDRPSIDIYLNYVLPNGTTKIEIEEVYNSGWTFVNNGQISASTVPTGFEGLTCTPRGNGVAYANNSDYATLASLQRSNFTANFTLADNNTYRARVLNCTGTITVTVPSINSVWSWFIIKNFNTTSGVITIHPSTTSVLIDGSNADIKLQPGESIMIHSKAANAYTIVFDGRFRPYVVSSASRSADIAANGTFTVPSYMVGKGQLLVYLDGCLSRQDDGWSEVGTAGTASTTIKFLQLIPKAMEIVVRVN